MSQTINCIECSCAIKKSLEKNSDFFPQLTKEEITREIKSLIEEKENKIESCICVNCLEEYFNISKNKATFAKNDIDIYIKSLKLLLLDISNQQLNDQIIFSDLNTEIKELIELKERLNKLKGNRNEIEKNLEKAKNELKDIKKKENNLYEDINKNIHDNEENENKLINLESKFNRLKKIYENICSGDEVNEEFGDNYIENDF